MEKTRLYAYIVFESNEVFPLEVVTSRLNVQPTRTWKIGERITPDHPTNKRERAFTAWKYEIDKETVDSDEVLCPLLEVFQEKTHIINELVEELKVGVRLQLVMHIYDGNTSGLYIHPAFSQFSAAINADLDIDMYVFPYSDPEESSKLFQS